MRRPPLLLLHSLARKGLVPPIPVFLYRHNANILHADQHQDSETGLFLMRVEWDLSDFGLDITQFGAHFAPIAEHLQMQWRLKLSSVRPKMAVFVSQYDHCLVDLLYRHQSAELGSDIP